MKKIVVCGKYNPEAVDLLKSKCPEGFSLTFMPKQFPQEDFVREVSDADYLFVRGATPVDDDVLSHAKQLKLIMKWGVGFDQYNMEQIGSYNPNTNPATIILDGERALAWLNVGAQPTLVTRRILSYEGVLLRKHLQGGVAKGALTQEQADQKWNEWKAQRDAKVNAKKEGLVKAASDKAKAAFEAEKKVNAERAEAIAKKAEELAEAQRKAAEEAAAKAAEEAAQEAPAEEA